MECRTIYNTRWDTRGNIYAVCWIESATHPGTFPVDGHGIAGLDDRIILDEGSRFSVLGVADYILGAGGVWYEEPSGGGGSGGGSGLPAGGTPGQTIINVAPGTGVWGDGTPGPAGKDGKDGADGATPVLQMGSVATGQPGTEADATLDPVGGNTYALNLTIPAGRDGTDGRNGTDGTNGRDGIDGATPTLEAGTITTGEPGTDVKASIDNVGGNRYALSLRIPRGNPGEDGAPGAPGKDAELPQGKTDDLLVSDGKGGAVAKELREIIPELTGGAKGQMLTKTGPEDFAFDWQDPPESGGGSGGGLSWQRITLKSASSSGWYQKTMIPGLPNSKTSRVTVSTDVYWPQDKDRVMSVLSLPVTVTATDNSGSSNATLTLKGRIEILLIPQAADGDYKYPISGKFVTTEGAANYPYTIGIDIGAINGRFYSKNGMPIDICFYGPLITALDWGTPEYWYLA